MMKRILLLALSLSLLITMSTACSGDGNSADDISYSNPIEVKVNDQNINSIVISKSDEDNTDTGSADSYPSIIENDAANLPYVKLGETIQVIFHDQTTEPDAFELEDFVLTEEGAIKFKGPALYEPKVDFDHGTASFILQENLLVFASSSFKDYEPGAVLRGFRLQCRWDNDTREIYFVVRTDASPHNE